MAKVPRAPSLEALRSRKPAVRRLRVGARLWRLYYRRGQHPTRWAEFRHVGPLDARFDHHLPGNSGEPIQQDRSVLYVAADPFTCLAEAYQTTRTINRRHKEPWLVGFDITKELLLLDLTGAFPTRSGASMGLMAVARSVARRWAQGYYAAYEDLHGLYYPSSMHANAPAIALTDRAEALDILPAHPNFHRALGDPAMLTILRNGARMLGYRLA